MNAKKAESDIFVHLIDKRIRTDREFFNIKYGDAVKIINEVCIKNNLFLRFSGRIVKLYK